MALTTAIFVGESKDWIPDLVAKAKELQVNEGTCFFFFFFWGGGGDMLTNSHN